MTENKQFVYYEHKGADYILENPNEDLDFIEMLGDCLDSEEIVNRLNELYNENEVLKSVNMEYEDALGRLEEENEQLRKDNRRLRMKIESLNENFNRLNKLFNEIEEPIDNEIMSEYMKIVGRTIDE